MEEINNVRTSVLMKRYFKPTYRAMFDKIKRLKTPLKNDLLMVLLDGLWHSESELIRIAKKQERQYVGAVTLGSMMNNINSTLQSTYLERKSMNGENWFKISDNYVGLSRAAFYKNYDFNL